VTTPIDIGAAGRIRDLFYNKHLQMKIRNFSGFSAPQSRYQRLRIMLQQITSHADVYQKFHFLNTSAVTGLRAGTPVSADPPDG
jgi:hypothetical protein